MPRPPRFFLLLCLPVLACAAPAGTEPPAGGGGYLEYVRNAPEFRRVRQDPDLLAGRWDTWLYMPWRYRWTIGTGPEGGRFCREHGINGGMTDHGEGPFRWLEQWGLRFYNDHTAGRGPLYLDPGGLPKTLPRDGRAVRPRPLDRALLDELGSVVTRRVRAVRGSPMRVAYALDDEISWGSFARPVPWRIHADDDAYARWLREYYRGETPPQARSVTPDDVFPLLGRPLAEIDLSPFLDRMTYHDSVWANAVGELVDRCNREDPSTPCGFVGGQAPSLWGGSDWAKLAKKVQFIEAYDLGSAQEILRSLLPAAPRVTTHFHDDARGPGNDSWLAWHYFAHGNRGMIGWVGDEWFDPEGTPRTWLGRFAPTLRELGGVQGPKMNGARWLHDGVALYYSHPSVQVSWILDSEAHGRTWPNRNDDHRLGTSHLVRKAWEEILTDAGLQYDFLAYDEIVLHGIPREVRVLILPAAFALSDVEARRIAEFVEAGGTVVADFAPGIFDQHGRGRRRGALDALFGVTHDGQEARADFFGGRLWVETDQDTGYSYQRYRELFETVRPRLYQGYAVAERRLPVGT
ncbi:MAG: beta-galactosidase trimerization domain-containing protein, partial [Thermoanaerobaculia bacterium]